MHQVAVSMLILKHLANCNTEVMSWKRFQTYNLEKAMQHQNTLTEPQTTIFLTHWTWQNSIANAKLEQHYQNMIQIEANLPIGSTIRIFPSIEELNYNNTKIADIRVLDEIAASTGAYRPITCYPYEPCKLQHEEDTVHKRSHSCGGDHVKVKSSDDNADLTCTGYERKKKTKKPSAKDAGVWFHQEYIDTFTTVGEFRVFIFAEPHAPSLRGRRGRVAHILHTEWSASDGKEIFVTSASEYLHFNRRDCRPLTRLQLSAFALDVYEKLREHVDWEKRFETLEVGVRLDVGVSPGKKDKRFFVNEITRLFEADFFSRDGLARPGTEICHNYAEALRGYFCGVEEGEGRGGGWEDSALEEGALKERRGDEGECKNLIKK